MTDTRRDAIHIAIGLSADHDFQIDDLWPDGDAPDEITAEVVADLIKQCGGLRRVMTDWCLDVDADIVVRRRNPHWVQDEVLFLDVAPPEKWTITTATVTS